MSTFPNPAEQEEQVDPSVRVLQWLTDNSKVLIISAAVVITGIAGLVGWNIYSENREQEAQVLLATAEGYLSIGNYEAALNGVESEFTLGFVQIQSGYGGTKAANLASYYASIAYYELGQSDLALQSIQDYKPVEGILGVGPIGFHAKLLEENGSYLAAADRFMDAAMWSENEGTSPDYMLQAAYNYQQAGDYDTALSVVDQLIDDYPQSLSVSQAKSLQGKLLVLNS
ncbi:MAG: tetratricopeptide repeat protein [Balneolaceae bacterium]|nr:tetratricopeptide repeat protein [Balneolaceae bacterium]MDR9446262.1 tetratricopeptide repeat protein [Balneolaceae bacterium]